MHAIPELVGLLGGMKLEIKIEKRPYKGKRSLRIQVQTKGWETAKIKDILELIQAYCVAEDYRYPQENGFKGRTLFMDACNEIGEGKKLDKVLKKYDISSKRKTMLIFEDYDSVEIFKEISGEERVMQMTLDARKEEPK